MLTLTAPFACSDIFVGVAGLVGALPLPAQGHRPDDETQSAASAGQHVSSQMDPSRQPRKVSAGVADQHSSREAEPSPQPRAGLWAARPQERQQSSRVGDDFPPKQQFWRGNTFVYMGSGAQPG